VFLVAQTIAAVWRAAQPQTAFDNSISTFATFRSEQMQEQNRQTENIKQNRPSIAQALANDESIRRELNLMRGSMDTLTQELIEHNNIMKQLREDLRDAKD
jgi:predicted RNase H-like nuclease (RuvC/YqgF family)